MTYSHPITQSERTDGHISRPLRGWWEWGKEPQREMDHSHWSGRPGGFPPLPTYAPSGPIRRPIMHLNATRKNPGRLEVTDPVVVLGDSNLSRIPHYDYPLVQVESFPGSQIHHLKGVLAKLPVCPNTQIVVLSGLNNCLRGNLPEV